MGDNKPTRQERKLLYIAPLIIGVAILVVLAAVFIVLPQSPPAPMVKVPRKALPDVPAHSAAAITPALPPLTRKDLIDNARNAAARFADGQPLPGDATLVGRNFSLRIAFACNGMQSGPAAQVSLNLDPANKSVTLAARPGDWTGLAQLQPAPGKTAIEAAAGFWIPRPWAYAEKCPPQRDYPVPATPTPATAPSLGLVQLSTASDSRVGQHGAHDYEFTRKITDADAAVLGHAYQLVLEGRITGFENGSALRCAAESPDHRPVCLYAVAFDHVAFEDADTGTVLANWTD
jgi:hypothetical protein